jgi:hypothetical protein
LIAKNKSIKIYTTWGNGSNLSEWKDEVEKIRNEVEVVQLVSPSLAARVPKGQNKFEYMLADWKSKINI